MSQLDFQERRQMTGHTALAVLIAVLMAAFSIFLPATAWAAPVNVTISGQQFDRQTASSSQTVKFSFNWSIPDGSHADDTFTVALPSELQPSNTASFQLRNSGGDVVATASWAGKTATFKLTSFVEGKTGINGSAFFMVSWDRSNVDTVNGGNYSLNFSGSANWTLPLTLEPDGASGEGQSTSKVGWWLTPDQGASDSKHQLGWVVYLDTGSDRNVPSPVVITDSPGSSSEIDITTVKGFSNNVEMSSARYSVARDGDRGVQIKLYGNYPGESAVYPGENIYFTYSSDLLPGENGVFTNRAVVEGLESEPQVVEARVLRDGAGGDGDGEVRGVIPVLPEVTQGVCTADGSVTAPTLQLADTTGISYEVTGAVAAGTTVTVTATAEEGYILTATDGWVLSADKRSATTAIVLNEVPCDQPVAPTPPEVNQKALAQTGNQGMLPIITSGIAAIVLGGAVLLLNARRRSESQMDDA